MKHILLSANINNTLVSAPYLVAIYSITCNTEEGSEGFFVYMPYNHHAHPPYATNMNTLVKRLIQVIVEVAKLHCHLQNYGSPIAIRLEVRVLGNKTDGS